MDADNGGFGRGVRHPATSDAGGGAREHRARRAKLKFNKPLTADVMAGQEPVRELKTVTDLCGV